MRAVVYKRFGGPEVLEVMELAEPHAGPGQVRVRVRAAGVNPMDWRRLAGGSGAGAGPERATVPGTDAAGTVDEVGLGVNDVREGDSVFGFAVTGSHAELAVLDAWAAVPVGVAVEEAGSSVVVGETAVRTLALLDVLPGQTLVIDGAAGGSGSAALQLALARGAQVIGTASTTNHGFLESFGAKATTYGPGLPDRVRELTGSVDAALDAAGKGAVPDLIVLTGDPTKVVTIADPTVAGLGVKMSFAFGNRAPALAQVANAMAAGTLRIPVASTFPLEGTAVAYRLSMVGHIRGKVVVVP